MNFKVIGVGGIGGFLVPALARYLAFAQTEVTMTLIDGDDFEERNRERQPFAQNGNKAQVTAEALGREFPQLLIKAVPEFITVDNAITLLRDGDLVFLCVDNHATRKLVSDRCAELENITLISGGNEYTDGNIQVYLRRNGADLTLPVANDFHPEIEQPKDRNPGEVGCGIAVETSPQLIFTNNMAAALMLGAFYGLQKGDPQFDEAYFDLLSMKVRPVRRQPRQEEQS